MPYTINNPPSWAKNLPKGAIRIAVKTFNAVYAKTKNEDQARQAAWAQIKKKYKKAGDKWVLKEKRHEDFQGILERFLAFFGEEQGLAMYKDFIKQNGLDETKPYTVEAQILGEKLRESFEWTEPRIKYWKKDKTAKYYKVRLLTANISMNKADYTDPEDMKFASSNLGWRPINIDHDHKLRLPYPDNRLEAGQLSDEGNCIETVVRIDNKAKKVQDMIAKQEIVHPSIEAHPICGLRLVDGKKVPSCGYYIDEVALLRKEYQLPGDPLSHVYPVPINEALASSLVESLQTHNHGELSEVLKENKPHRGEKEEMNEQYIDKEEATVSRSDIDYLQRRINDLSDSVRKTQQFVKALTKFVTATDGKSKIDSLIDELTKMLEAVEETKGKLSEAVWDIKYVNNLPDSSFAYIEAGGKKDDEGKTVPRNLRHMPIKNAEGKLDAAHVRAALAALKGARAGQVPSYAGKAKPKVCAAAKQLKIESEVCGTAESVEKMEEEASKDRKIADLTNELLEKEKDITLKDESIREKDQSLERLARKLSKIEKDLAKRDPELAETRDALEKAREQLAKEEAGHSTTKGKLEETQKEHEKTIIREKEKDETIGRLEERIGKQEIRISELRRKLDDESAKRAEAAQKALNETKETGRVREENADLREDVADQTRKISELSQKRVDDAKKIHGLEMELSVLKEKHETLTNDYRHAKRLAKAQTKVLEKMGIKLRNS